MIAAAGLAFWREAPYAILPFLIVMAAWYTTRVGLTRGGQKPVHEERDRGRERTLTTSVFVGMVIFPIVALATPVLDFAAYAPMPGQIVIGLAVGCAGLHFIWRSHADLGANWSAHLELRDDHRLVTNGIYARIRHPMYTAIFLLTAAQAILLSSWLAGQMGPATFFLLYIMRIEAEEMTMRDRFGEEWEVYAARTARLLPKLTGS